MQNLHSNQLPTYARPLLIQFGFYYNLGSWEICSSRKAAIKKQQRDTLQYSVVFNSIDELRNSRNQHYWKFKSFRRQVQSYLTYSNSESLRGASNIIQDQHNGNFIQLKQAS